MLPPLPLYPCTLFPVPSFLQERGYRDWKEGIGIGKRVAGFGKRVAGFGKEVGGPGKRVGSFGKGVAGSGKREKR